MMRKMVRIFRLCAFVLMAMVVTDAMAQGYREGELIVKFRSERAETRGISEGRKADASYWKQRNLHPWRC